MLTEEERGDRDKWGRGMGGGVFGHGGKRVKEWDAEIKGGEREEAMGDEETKGTEPVEKDEEPEKKQQKCEK